MQMTESDASRAIVSAGFTAGPKTVKVIEYASAAKSRVLYLRLGQGFPDHADIVINPEVPTSSLLSIPGIALNPKVELRFGSNMKAFPKALNNGQKPQHYGRAFQASTVEALAALCRAYSLIP